MELTAKNFRAFAHGYKTDSGVSFHGTNPLSMIFHFEHQRGWQKVQANPGFFRAGMPRDIVQRFLQHAIDLHPR